MFYNHVRVSVIPISSLTQLLNLIKHHSSRDQDYLEAYNSLPTNHINTAVLSKSECKELVL
jgi:hypothetical protein